jgi:hypothetical protein
MAAIRKMANKQNESRNSTDERCKIECNGPAKSEMNSEMSEMDNLRVRILFGLYLLQNHQ